MHETGTSAGSTTVAAAVASRSPMAGRARLHPARPTRRGRGGQPPARSRQEAGKTKWPAKAEPTSRRASVRSLASPQI